MLDFVYLCDRKKVIVETSVCTSQEFHRNILARKPSTQKPTQIVDFRALAVFHIDSVGENQTGGDIHAVSTVTSCRFFAGIDTLNQLNLLLHKDLLV